MSRFLYAFTLVVSTAVAAPARGDDVDSFMSGLNALAAGKYEEAAALLGKAAEAQPKVAIRQLDHGVALLMLGRSDDAKAAFERAKAISDSDDVRVWSLARQMMFEPALPDMSKLPKDNLSYSKKLFVASLGTRSPDAGERARAFEAIGEAVRQFVDSQRTGFEAIKALYLAKRYEDALKLIDPLLKREPENGLAHSYAAHCKLGLRDYVGAREHYTRSLRALPLDGGSYVGRARCATALGALKAAEADLAMAKQLITKPVAALLGEAEQLLAKAKSSAGRASDDSLTSRAEAYTRELTRLHLAVREQPKEIAPLLALSNFHLQPVAPCEITLSGVTQTLRVPCGAKNVPAAHDAYSRAARLAPEDPRVFLQEARMDLARMQLDHMIKAAQKAYAKDTMDLEIAVAALKYNADAANRAVADAKKLRWDGYFIEIINDQGRREKKFIGPSVDELNRANELEKHAKKTRENATLALQLLQRQSKASSDPQSQFTLHMVNAYHGLWYRNLSSAIEEAEKALALDAGSEHALRFLVEACSGAKSPKAEQYRAMLKEIQRY